MKYSEVSVKKVKLTRGDGSSYKRWIIKILENDLWTRPDDAFYYNGYMYGTCLNKAHKAHNAKKYRFKFMAKRQADKLIQEAIDEVPHVAEELEEDGAWTLNTKYIENSEQKRLMEEKEKSIQRHYDELERKLDKLREKYEDY